MTTKPKSAVPSAHIGPPPPDAWKDLCETYAVEDSPAKAIARIRRTAFEEVRRTGWCRGVFVLVIDVNTCWILDGLDVHIREGQHMGFGFVAIDWFTYEEWWKVDGLRGLARAANAVAMVEVHVGDGEMMLQIESHVAPFRRYEIWKIEPSRRGKSAYKLTKIDGKAGLWRDVYVLPELVSLPENARSIYDTY